MDVRTGHTGARGDAVKCAAHGAGGHVGVGMIAIRKEVETVIPIPFHRGFVHPSLKEGAEDGGHAVGHDDVPLLDSADLGADDAAGGPCQTAKPVGRTRAIDKGSWIARGRCGCRW